MAHSPHAHILEHARLSLALGHVARRANVYLIALVSRSAAMMTWENHASAIPTSTPPSPPAGTARLIATCHVPRHDRHAETQGARIEGACSLPPYPRCPTALHALPPHSPLAGPRHRKDYEPSYHQSLRTYVRSKHAPPYDRRRPRIAAPPPPLSLPPHLGMTIKQYATGFTEKPMLSTY